MSIWKPKYTAEGNAQEIDKLRGELKAAVEEIKTYIDLRLESAKKDFEIIDIEIGHMEQSLLERIDHAEKIARIGSLEGDKPNEKSAEFVGAPGYRSWSQRKSERINKHADRGFAGKVRKRSTDTPSTDTGTAT